jgi:trk system potassium uptake protein
MAKKTQYAVFGLGRFGQSIVKTLIENEQHVFACDIDREKVQDVAAYATHVVNMDVNDEQALASIGIGNFDVVIVCIGKSMEATSMVILTAKEEGVPKIIVKANSIKQKNLFEKIGADRVVLPEKEMGARIATNLLSENIIEFINLSEEFCIAEINPPKKWIGLSILKSNIRASHGLNIVAIKRGEEIIISPNANESIKEADILVIIGDALNVRKLKSGG